MDQIIEKAVYLQQTSPNFATFCVEHVQDPSYQFLFSEEERTGERRRYLHLIEKSRKRRRREEEKETSAPLHLYGTSAADGLLTAYDAAVLWEDMRCRSHSGAATGPHLPLPFSRQAKLHKFLSRVLHFAEHPSEKGRDCLVSFMMRYLPMTETFHCALSYVFRELLFLLHATRSEEVRSVVGRVGEQALRHLLELYTAHLYAHKQQAQNKSVALYYGGCFEHFGAQMLTLCAEELRQFGVSALSLSFFTLCNDAALTWSLDFTREAAAIMETLGHSFVALMQKIEQ